MFVRLFFTILFVFTCLNNSVREICNRIKIRKEIPKTLRWSDLSSVEDSALSLIHPLVFLIKGGLVRIAIPKETPTISR